VAPYTRIVSIGVGTLIGTILFLALLAVVIGWAFQHQRRQYPPNRIVVGELENPRRFGPMTIFTWLSGGRG
jgi:hypothetical protein